MQVRKPAPRRKPHRVAASPPTSVHRPVGARQSWAHQARPEVAPEGSIPVRVRDRGFHRPQQGPEAGIEVRRCAEDRFEVPESIHRGSRHVDPDAGGGWRLACLPPPPASHRRARPRETNEEGSARTEPARERRSGSGSNAREATRLLTRSPPAYLAIRAGFVPGMRRGRMPDRSRGFPLRTDGDQPPMGDRRQEPGAALEAVRADESAFLREMREQALQQLRKLRPRFEATRQSRRGV